ncbi:MAG: hypothetical protein E6Q89_07430 [Bacteroidia bacterium]|nr:MAG: hypothetical protein E6Q89_07430 [Bacteroidia bacterium]
MNWLKKKLNQIVDKLNSDDTYDTSFSEVKKQEKIVSASQKYDNIEEFKEISSNIIVENVRLLSYSKTKVSQIIFYTSLSENAVESQALKHISNDEGFIKDLKRALRSKSISYTDDLSVHTNYNIQSLSKYTKVNEVIGVEVLTPQTAGRKIKASLKAVQGVLWQDEYMIEPRDLPYFIGRCLEPEMPNGAKLKNDIAFVGIEEKNEEQYKINSHVSRSHAVIMYDESVGAFALYRSKYLKNPAQKLKVVNSKNYNDEGVAINQSTVPHILKDGDYIYLNESVILAFHILM